MDNLFIPYIFKISTKCDILKIFRIIPNTIKLNSKQNKGYSYLLSKINSNQLSISNLMNIHSVTYKFLLNNKLKEKKEVLKKNFNIEALYNKNWVELRGCLRSPIYSFQHIYFRYLNRLSLVETIGEELAIIIEEILRDYYVSSNEKNYFLEKASILGLPAHNIEKFIDNPLKFNPAIKNLIYEICKDGKITDAENSYLLEKAKHYKIKSDQIHSEIESVVKTIKSIHRIFKNEQMYNTILLFYLIKYIDPNNSELQNKLLNKYIKYIDYESNEIPINPTSLKTHIIYCFNNSSGFKIFNEENTTIENLYNKLSLKIIPFTDIHKILEDKLSRKLSPKKLIKSLNGLSERKNTFDKDLDCYDLGSEKYEFQIIDKSEYPLFSYDTIGNRTIISLNKNHYFFDKSKDLKLKILSLVINLKKNYANEDLIEEIQYLFNPPANIRINFPK